MARTDRRGVFLYGYYGAGNLGDDLLLAVLVAELRTILPGARFVVRDHGDTAMLDRLGPDVSFTGIEAIAADRSRSRLVRLFAYLSAYARHFRQCRWLVFGGGTLFHARGTLTSLLLQYAICLIARACGLRIAALGVGVADLPSPAARFLLRRIVGLSALFLVRDEPALRQCVGTKARVTADLAFALPAAAMPPRRDGVPLRLGLTVYPPVWESATVRAALGEAMRRWRESGHELVLLACQRGGVAPGDADVFAQLLAAQPAARGIEIRPLHADAVALWQALADIDVVCGMRFHGLVLAAMAGRPFVGIAYDNKVEAICRDFGMPLFAASSLDGRALAGAVEPIRHRIPDPQLVERRRVAARDSFRAFAALVT